MKDDKLKIGIKEIKEIRMTDLEKDRILKNILNSPAISQETPVKSPWTVFSFISIMHKNRLVYYGFVLSLVVLGGGAVFASGNSLPGNVLYPLKVSVVEPIQSAFTFSSKAKAEYESKLATKRLVEAEILESRGKLDKVKEEKLSLLLEDHTRAFNKAIEDDDDDDDTITNFQAGLNAHAKVLELLNERDDKSEKQEKNNKISETARVSANKIRTSFKENKDEEKDKDNNEDKSEDKNKERNEERKKHVREIIDRTVKELDVHTSIDVSPVRRTIIDDTHKTLEEANRYLREADEEDEKGDTKEAYFKLLDSESSAKEAGIFLKSGLKFKEYKNERTSEE